MQEHNSTDCFVRKLLDEFKKHLNNKKSLNRLNLGTFFGAEGGIWCRERSSQISERVFTLNSERHGSNQVAKQLCVQHTTPLAIKKQEFNSCFLVPKVGFEPTWFPARF